MSMEKDDQENVTVESLGVSDPFSFHERCLQEGICPKGCGSLEVKSYNERVCPVCHFVHYNANPERAPHATE
jgi:heterodisulfide reductase subunit C